MAGAGPGRRHERALALDYAAAVNEELRHLKRAGADVVQLDEPYLQARPEKARQYAVAAIDRALDGIEGPTVLHTCFSYAHVVKRRLPGYTFLDELNDCAVRQVSLEAGMKYLDREVAFGKLQALVAGTRLVRAELGLGA